MSESFWAFLGISVLVITTPGPDTAMTIRSTIIGGRAGGFFTALGVSTGLIIWALATSAGLVAILLASEVVFNAVKIAGAAYLIWLGVQALIGALRAGTGTAPDAGAAPRRRLSRSAAFRNGLISDLGNPKMAMFFASILPQFAAPSEGMFSTLVGFGVLFSVLTFLWLSLYIAAIAKAAGLFARSRVRRMLEGLMGGILIALGVRLAAEHR
jgi:threonine/homoserine/homoserine lactone efflux protein